MNKAQPGAERRTVEDVALHLLARREHSTFELRNKLLLRGYSEAEITPVIEAFTECGYLSDDRYTEAGVRVRINKGDGPLKIRAYLLEHGVANSVVSKHLNHNEEFWLAQAVEVDRRIVRLLRDRNPDESSKSLFGKRARRLKNRGYPASIIARVLDRTVRTSSNDNE